jgi:hypothetical protein
MDLVELESGCEVAGYVVVSRIVLLVGKSRL